MKRVLVSSIACVVLAVILTSGVMDHDGKAGATGSPGEGTCNQTNCHNSYAVNSGTGSISLTSNMNNWTYSPGQTYTISMTVRRTGSRVFGLGVEVLKPNGDNAGTLIVTNPLRTTIKTKTISGYIRRNIVHTLNAGHQNDSSVFTFNWTAPSTNIGAVTLYAAGNCGNYNDSANGDYVYTTSRIISFDNTTGINDLIQTSNSVSVFPNPASEAVNVSFDQDQTENTRIILTDMKGAVAGELYSGIIPAGNFNQSFSLPSLSSGIYLMRIESASTKLSKRIVIK